jgi:hypothetical protein
MKIDDIVIGKEYMMFINYGIHSMPSICSKCTVTEKPFETHEQQYKFYQKLPVISVETPNGMYMYQNASFHRYMQQNGCWMRDCLQVKYEDGTTGKLNCSNVYELLTEYEICNVYWVLHEGKLIQSMLLSVDDNSFKFIINKQPTLISKENIKIRVK